MSVEGVAPRPPARRPRQRGAVAPLDCGRRSVKKPKGEVLTSPFGSKTSAEFGARPVPAYALAPAVAASVDFFQFRLGGFTMSPFLIAFTQTLM